MESIYAIPQPAVDPEQEAADALLRELVGMFEVHSVEFRQQGKLIAFTGRMLVDAESAYDIIEGRFQDLGYTPLLRRQKKEDVVVAVKGVAGKSGTGNPLINIVLFLATVLTTLAAGASLACLLYTSPSPRDRS